MQIQTELVQTEVCQTEAGQSLVPVRAVASPGVRGIANLYRVMVVAFKQASRQSDCRHQRASWGDPAGCALLCRDRFPVPGRLWHEYPEL